MRQERKDALTGLGLCAASGLAMLALCTCVGKRAAAADFTSLEVAYDVASTADMLTTLDIKKHPELQETNALLGAHPSDAKVLAYFAGTDLLHALITRELVHGNAPDGLIRAWEYVSIGVETGFAAHNYSIGLRCKL
jgi:hypothetical protein